MTPWEPERGYQAPPILLSAEIHLAIPPQSGQYRELQQVSEDNMKSLLPKATLAKI